MAWAATKRALSTLFYPLHFCRVKQAELVENFIASRSGPFSGAVELNNHRVYILPTRAGVIFTLLLLFLFLGAINYDRSLGFMLTFLLVGLGLVGILSTWRNLAGLRVSGQGASPVFAGQEAIFNVRVENYSADQRYAVSISAASGDGNVVDVPPGAAATLYFKQVTTTRGYLNPGRIKIMTEFPLSLFVAWTQLDLSMQCLVYPRPATQAPSITGGDIQAGEEQAEGAGLEDFSGLRKFQPGDSWKKVAWKTVARLDELYSKEFIGGQPEQQWIDWFILGKASQEERLSMMTRMVLNAQQAGHHYGLRLPGMVIKPDNGRLHQHQCLQALALYGL